MAFFAVSVVAVVVGVMPVLCSRATAAQPQPLPGVIAGYLGHHVATERYALGNPIVGVDRFEETEPPKCLASHTTCRQPASLASAPSVTT